jgi:hypothetical protein
VLYTWPLSHAITKDTLALKAAVKMRCLVASIEFISSMWRLTIQKQALSPNLADIVRGSLHIFLVAFGPMKGANENHNINYCQVDGYQQAHLTEWLSRECIISSPNKMPTQRSPLCPDTILGNRPACPHSRGRTLSSWEGNRNSL